MSTVRRTMIAGALAFPLALGTAGMASADSGYDAEGSYAGPDGVGTYSVSSHADNEPGDNGHTEDDITDFDDIVVTANAPAVDDIAPALDIGLAFGGPYLTSGMTSDAANPDDITPALDDLEIVDPTSASVECQLFGC